MNARIVPLLIATIVALSSCGTPSNHGEESRSSENTAKGTDNSGSAAPSQKTTGNATAVNGAKIYAMYCTSCHGNDGQAGVSGAKNLALSELEKGGVKEMIRNGSENNKMIAYGNLLDEEEIDALADYVMEFREN